MAKSRKKVVHLHNRSGSLENVIQFLESVQKHIGYLSLNVDVDGGCEDISVTLVGPSDLQQLASQRLQHLAEKYLD